VDLSSDGGADESMTTTEIVAVSQHASKKKHGHRRMSSKERVPAIGDIEDSLMENHLSRSSGISKIY